MIQVNARDMLKVDCFVQRVPPAIWQYALAVVSVAVALAITDALEPYTHSERRSFI
jgi:hypothetical protein